MKIKKLKKIVKEFGLADLGDKTSVVINTEIGLIDITDFELDELKDFLGY
jgi:hypothetical protein